jgi:NitT/TauT family transport system substrate-binding protein
MRALLLAALVLLAPRLLIANARAQTPITIGYTAGSAMVPVLIASQQGIFARHGLAPKLIQIAFTAITPQALAGGTIDIGVGTAPVLLNANDAGLDLVAVSGLTRQIAARPVASLLTRTGLAISTPADLRGHSVAIAGLNGVFDVLLHAWLDKVGVPAGDIRLIELPFPRMEDALRTRTVDAVAVVEPFRSRILAAGTAQRLADFVADLAPDVIDAFWIARRDWATSHTTALANFRAALNEAITITQTDRATAESVEKSAFGAVGTVMPSYSTHIAAEDLAFYGNLAIKQGLLSPPAPDYAAMVLAE